MVGLTKRRATNGGSRASKQKRRTGSSTPTARGWRLALKQRGFTLVELVITIVVLGIAATGLLLAYTNIIVRSADPLLRVQAAAIAQAYLEEISLQPVLDPDGSNAGETRASYDNIADYAGLTEPPTDRTGAPIASLADYGVVVSIDSSANISGVPATEINVTVTAVAGNALTLTGYRTNY